MLTVSFFLVVDVKKSLQNHEIEIIFCSYKEATNINFIVFGLT
jgi:hypothetical protein